MISLDTKCSVPKQSQAASIATFPIINEQSHGYKKLVPQPRILCLRNPKDTVATSWLAAILNVVQK